MVFHPNSGCGTRCIYQEVQLRGTGMGGVKLKGKELQGIPNILIIKAYKSNKILQGCRTGCPSLWDEWTKGSGRVDKYILA